MDEALKAELNFSKIIGLRFAICLKFFAEQDSPERLLGLALVLEPLRLCTAWWLRRGRAIDFRTRSYLLDALYDRFSPVMFAAQYLCTLLDGASARLVLWWRRGAESYDQFCAVCPGSVRAFRRMLLVAAAGLFRRHLSTFSSLEWAISSVCDDRVPLERRRFLANKYDSTPSCCIPPGTIRDLKLAGTTGDDLMDSPELQHLLHWRCMLVCQPVVDIEWKHGQCRSRSNKHGDSLHILRRRLHQLRRPLGSRGEGPHPDSDPHGARPTRQRRGCRTPPWR